MLKQSTLSRELICQPPILLTFLLALPFFFFLISLMSFRFLLLTPKCSIGGNNQWIRRWYCGIKYQTCMHEVQDSIPSSPCARVMLWCAHTPLPFPSLPLSPISPFSPISLVNKSLGKVESMENKPTRHRDVVIVIQKLELHHAVILKRHHSTSLPCGTRALKPRTPCIVKLVLCMVSYVLTIHFYTVFCLSFFFYTEFWWDKLAFFNLILFIILIFFSLEGGG